MNKTINLRTHTCKQCGKEFEAYAGHIYKIPTSKTDIFMWFCSYKCIQEYRKQTAKKPTEKERLVLEMLDGNHTIKNITETLKVSKETIYKIKDKWRSPA